MDRNTLGHLLAEEIAWHTKNWANARAYFVKDEAQQLYAALIAPDAEPGTMQILVAAHVEGETIVIDTNTTDKSLRDALRAVGVPNEHIADARVDQTVKA